MLFNSQHMSWFSQECVFAWDIRYHFYFSVGHNQSKDSEIHRKKSGDTQNMTCLLSLCSNLTDVIIMVISTRPQQILAETE